MGGETMDDLTKKGAADLSKINTQEAWQVDYWTKELGVSKGELERLVKKVGNSAVAVRKELGLLGTPH
jgi:Protein of unknown function (DUF3606)